VEREVNVGEIEEREGERGGEKEGGEERESVCERVRGGEREGGEGERESV
jgi:hypothetical protein